MIKSYKKRTIRKLLIMIVIVISSFFVINSVFAEYSEWNYTIGGGTISAPCTSQVCSGTQYLNPTANTAGKTDSQLMNELVYGARFTLYKKQGDTRVKTNYTADIWRSSANVSSPENVGSNTIFFEGTAPDSSGKYVQIPRPGQGACDQQQSVPYCYVKWLKTLENQVNNGNNTVLRNILRKVDPSGSISDYNNYDLLMEPLLLIYYRYYDNISYYKGTISEVTNWLDSKNSQFTRGGVGSWYVLTNNFNYLQLASPENPFNDTQTHTTGIGYYQNYWGSIFGKVLMTYLDKIGSITITKKDDRNVPVSGIKFYIKEGSNQVGNCITNSSGKCTINGLQLNKTYVVYEYNPGNNNYDWNRASYDNGAVGTLHVDPSSPNGLYSVYTKVTLNNSNQRANITVTNPRSCGKRLQEIKSSGQTKLEKERSIIDLYYYYYTLEEQTKYGKLLDFSGSNLENSLCEPAECNSQNNACLYYNKVHKNNDYSCYSDINNLDTGGIKYICTTNFSFKNSMEFDNLSSKNFYAYKGQSLNYKKSDGLSYELYDVSGNIANIELSKSCYVLDNTKFQQEIVDSKLDDESYKNYINNYLETVKFNDVGLVVKEKSKVDDGISENRRKIILNYDVNVPLSALEMGTGKVTYETSEQYEQTIAEENYRVGDAIYSSYSREARDIVLPFEIKFKNHNNAKLQDYLTTDEGVGSCFWAYIYDENELLPPSTGNPHDLNLDFRVIDTTRPFVNIDGDDRNTMTNWCYNKERTSIEDDMDEIDATLISRYNNGMIKFNSDKLKLYDVYGDGEVNEIDKMVISNNITNLALDQSDCSNNNLVVESVIKNRVNSYGLLDGVKKEPKYKIVLTPTLMQTINSIKETDSLSYNDFNLDCKDTEGSECTEDSDYRLYTSKLLTKLNDSGDLIINYSKKR